MVSPVPLSSLKFAQHFIPPHGLLPNSAPTGKPLLHYRGTFPPDSTDASSVEAHLRRIGVVEPQWRYTMYSQTHFHSTTHEILSVVSGKALLLFGGEDNPGSVLLGTKKGDVIIVPAGVAHRLMKDEGEFEMVGAYPKGAKKWDMCYGREDEESAVESISKLEWFSKDPIYGDSGPVLEV